MLAPMGTRKRMTMSELTSSYTDAKRANERFDLWLYHVGRRFSWPVAWLAVNLGISATTVTFISTFFVWTGAVLIALGNPLWQIIGTLFFQLWIIFDCADGTVARATGTGSKRGEYADAFGGYSVSMLLYSSMGVAAARAALELEVVVPYILTLSGLGGVRVGGAAAVDTTETILSAGRALDFIPLSTVFPALILLLAGVGASILSLFSRLLYQKFLNIFGADAAAARPIKPREDRTNPVMVLAQNVAANSGFPLPLAIIAVAAGYTGIYVTTYFFVNAAMLLLTMGRTLTRPVTGASGASGPAGTTDTAETIKTQPPKPKEDQK